MISGGEASICSGSYYLPAVRAVQSPLFDHLFAMWARNLFLLSPGQDAESDKEETHEKRADWAGGQFVADSKSHNRRNDKCNTKQ